MDKITTFLILNHQLLQKILYQQSQYSNLIDKLISKYCDKIKNNLLYIPSDCLVSGFVFYWSSLIFISHFPNWKVNANKLISYNLLYLFVDGFIDNNKIDTISKKDTISQMTYILKSDVKQSDDLFLNEIIDKYSVLNSNETTVKYLNKLFYFEANLFNQKVENLSFNDYLNICYEKGRLTARSVSSLVFDSINYKHIDNIGEISQLIDDLFDIPEDQNNNIKTVATYCLEHNHNVDVLYETVVKKIYNLPNHYILLKMLFSSAIVYHVSKYNYYSKHIKSQFASFDYSGLNTRDNLKNKIFDYLRI